MDRDRSEERALDDVDRIALAVKNLRVLLAAAATAERRANSTKPSEADSATR